MTLYGRIANETVVELFETDLAIASLFNPSLIWVALDNVAPQPGIGWSAACTDGNWTFTPPIVAPPSLPALITQFEQQVQAWLDATAQQNGYGGSLACLTYLSSSNTTWQADAQAMLAWRDAVWSAAFALEETWVAGVPFNGALSQLPQAAALGWVVRTPVG